MNMVPSRLKLMMHTLTLLLCLPFCYYAAPDNHNPPVEYCEAIRINQTGYYPSAIKTAVIALSAASDSFQLVQRETRQVVFQGRLSAPTAWKLAGETVRIADFSAMKIPGEYMLFVRGLGSSYPFRIGHHMYAEALKASMKSFYFQRASMPLDKKHAGDWHRPAGHPDQKIILHPSTGRSGIIASPGGWYDAGDFGKYTVNGGYSLGLMLFLCEQYPQVLGDNSLLIPENGNGNSDFLDEMKYQMDWLLTMQDADGGVFFKVTTAEFPDMIMPHADTMTRYMVGKGTAASLVFAAVAAKMHRIYKVKDAEYAARCLQAATMAWNWSQANPQEYFKNPDDIKTGEYGDSDLSEEFYWAAAELLAATYGRKYAEYLSDNTPDLSFREGNSWATFARFLGAFTLISSVPENLEAARAKRGVMEAADSLLARTETNDYLQPVTDFHWGSNSDVLDAAMIMAMAFRITDNKKYLKGIQQSVDYIFGKNATGYSFVTGYGTKTPLSIHHRQSQADNMALPVPGFVSGGPNSRLQDAAFAKYPPDAPPMKCWVDDFNSYASNEICNNWNAPLVYILGFLESELSH
jgi:endoglucanase